jgi:hypothetical protein
MIALSDEQIKTVREWLNNEGVDREDLACDMLDHLCCLIEHHMEAGDPFERACRKTFESFVPATGIKSIQLEIQIPSLLKNLFMKKTILLLASASMFFYFVSTLFFALSSLNDSPWKFSVELAFANQFLICGLVLPLYWYEQYRNTLLSADGFGVNVKRLAMISGFICSQALANAVFFKLMHMPGGNYLFALTAVSGMVYVPFYSLRKYRLA